MTEPQLLQGKRDEDGENSYTQKDFDLFTSADVITQLRFTMSHQQKTTTSIHTDWQNTTDPEDTLDIGMMKLRWNVNMTLVKRTMKTIYAAFSKSVN